MKRVFLETYGCQMNVADSEVMAGVLERAGMELVTRPDEADAVILNTCAIREHAEARVVGRLGDLSRHKARRPGVRLGVTGCMAQHLRQRLLDHDQVRILHLQVRELAEPAEHALLGVLADGAGVEHYGVGVLGAVGERQAGLLEHAGHGFAVGDVHLTAVGFQEDAFHGGEGA